MGRGVPGLVCVWLLGLTSACGLFGGPRLDPYLGQMLRTSDAGGIEALEQVDQMPPVRAWLEQSGRPDYVLIQSPRSVLFFYLGRDEAVSFAKPLFFGELEPSVSTPIRADYHNMFSNSDKERLARVRMGSAPRRTTPEPRSGVIRRRVGGDEERSGSGGRP